MPSTYYLVGKRLERVTTVKLGHSILNHKARAASQGCFHTLVGDISRVTYSRPGVVPRVGTVACRVVWAEIELPMSSCAAGMHKSSSYVVLRCGVRCSGFLTTESKGVQEPSVFNEYEILMYRMELAPPSFKNQ